MNYDPSNSLPSDAASYIRRTYSSIMNVFWVPVIQKQLPNYALDLKKKTVSAQPIGPNFKVKQSSLLGPTFRHCMSVPYRKVKQASLL